MRTGYMTGSARLHVLGSVALALNIVKSVQMQLWDFDYSRDYRKVAGPFIALKMVKQQLLPFRQEF